MRYFVVLVFILMLSVLYVILEERTSAEYSPPGLSFFDGNVSEDINVSDKDLKKKRVLIFDISDLNCESPEDTLNCPFIAGLMARSKVYRSTFNLSTERNLSLRSFFECLPPYKLYDGPGPFSELKVRISEDLRNSSMINEFKTAGYRTRGFFNDSLTNASFEKYFSSSGYYSTKERIAEAVYSGIYNDISENILYYVDMTGGAGDEFYKKRTDDLISSVSDRLRERSRIDLRILLISTKTDRPLSKTMTVFYGFGSDAGESDDQVASTDMSRLLMKLCGVRPKNYFGGYDLEDAEDEAGRDIFAGLSGDTLLLFNDEMIYKKVKHSNSYSLFDRIQSKDVTSVNIGINEKYEEMIPRYFGGDYVKYIILKNRSGQSRNFRIDIRSRRRFEEFSNLQNYYLQKRRNNRYSNTFGKQLEPGMCDTVRIYYSGLYQDFQYSFNEKLSIRYGPGSIYAGAMKSFNENSYYGMRSCSKYDESEDFDLRIFNMRINY